MIRRFYLARRWHDAPACVGCRLAQRAADAGIDAFFAYDFARARRAGEGR